MRRLIIRPGGVGDFIVSLPALECLKYDYTEVWTSPANVPLARFADRARSIPSTGLNMLAVTDPPPRLLEDLRQFDSIVSWYGANRPEFRELVFEMHLPFRFFSALPEAGAGMHAIDFYLEQVRTIATIAGERFPHIDCPKSSTGNFAVIHPFSGSARKNWPLENFRALASELERTMPVHWCAGSDDPPLEGAIRFDDLYALGCWLSSAALYVGNDSGITHLAAAVGTPVLALFGPTDPAIWAPRGPNVRIGLW